MATPQSNTSSTSVLPPMSPRSVARLSRVSSTTGAVSSRSLKAYRTVSLPGLVPGTSIGILASGPLDKRRDGAVRGGWAKRLFILSTRSLHYYRKSEEFELFGKERGQAHLSDIGMARIVPPEDAPYGAVEPGMSNAFIAIISRKKSLLMFLRADSLELATSWANTINRAIQIAQAINFAPRWPAEVIQKFTSAASGNFEEGVIGDDDPAPTEGDAPVTPRVLVVSMISGDTSPQFSRERLVKRQLELETELELGAFRPKDVCVLVLSDGEEIHIPHQALGPNVRNLLKEEKELVLSTPPRPRSISPDTVLFSRVHVYIRCSPAPPPVPLTPQNSGVITSTQAPASALSVAFPGGLGSLFLLSCVVAFWFGIPFEGLMKMAILVGFVLAVSQVSQSVISAATGAGGKSSSSALPTKSTASSMTKSSEPDLIYYIRVDKIEVMEHDQELVPQPPSTGEESTENADTTTDAEADAASAISGGPIPFSQRFIAAEKGDEEKGRQRYENTLQWRRENEIDNILIRPHRTFETIKKYYPQYFHGRSKKGLPVYYEQPGKIDLAGLKREGLSIEDLLQHYMYITEYLWRVIEPSDTGRSVTVLDVSGIGMSDLGGEVLDFIKRASAFTGAHYPERSSMIFIINIPGWFNMIWRMIKPLIDPVTREKIHMLKGSAILKELEMHIDADQIPSELGGRGVSLGDSQEEHGLREHVTKYLNK